MDEILSRQISFLRPVCIILMMSVHVNPGFDPENFPPLFREIAAFEVNVLGRASVSTLSLISGFLIAWSSGTKAIWPHISQRFKTLYVPALVWNAIFLTLVVLGGVVTGSTFGATALLEGIDVSELILERLLFLYGEPGTPILAFLRDLCVASVITIFLTRATLRVTGAALVTVLVLTLTDSMAPLIYRESILLFMLAGCFLQKSRGNLDVPAALVLASIPVLLYYVAIQIDAVPPPMPGNGIVVELRNVAGRAALSVLALWASRRVVLAGRDARVASVADAAYLAFLSHTTVISVMWVVWGAAFGPAGGDEYVVFFFAAQMVAFAVAVYAMRHLSALWWPAQVALAGKRVARRPGPRAAGKERHDHAPASVLR